MALHMVINSEKLQIPKKEGYTGAANKGINPDNIKIGQELTMPNKITQQPNQKEFKTTDEKEVEGIKEYKIQIGDNLSKIAKKYGCKVVQLKAANNLKSDIIIPGQILIIPVSSPQHKTVDEAVTKTSSAPKNSQQKRAVTAEEKAKYLNKLIYSDTAVRNNINNTPQDLQTKINLDSLIENAVIPVVQELEKNGIKIQITSGYRSPELNKKVGSKPTSQHCKGQAFDFQVIPNNRETIAKAFKIIKNSGIPIDQMLLEKNKKGTQWIHLSYNPTGHNRRHLIENYKA